MGKYMKKSKLAGSVAVMEVSPQSCIGVRTRAKTLALQRLQNQDMSTARTTGTLDASSLSYLQLRSRRLEKPSVLVEPKKLHKGCCRRSPRPSNRGMESSLRMGSVKSASLNSVELCEEHIGAGLEPSLGENYLENQGRDRNNRESTPCSLIRDSDANGTPGSSTTRLDSCTRNVGVGVINGETRRRMPTALDLEEFFAYAERQQQIAFTDKYDFDIVNELPFSSGRYEWVSVLN